MLPLRLISSPRDRRQWLEEELVTHMLTEAAVGFELRFREELVGRGVVQEHGFVEPVPDELALVPRERSLT
jgi:hypothetical protein